MDYTNHWKKQKEVEVKPRNYRKYLIYLAAGALGIVAGIGLWKIASHDYCPAYYGVSCLPPKQWKQVINTDKHLSPSMKTGTLVQSAQGLNQ